MTSRLFLTSILLASATMLVGCPVDGTAVKLGQGARVGSGSAYGYIDGKSPEASLHFPADVAIAAGGTAYIAESGEGTVRSVGRDGTVGTVAGARGDLKDSDPYGFAFDADKGHHLLATNDGTLFLATPSAVVRLDADGTTALLAGGDNSGFADGRGEEAAFDYIRGIARGADGMLYVSDRENNAVRRITPDGMVTTLARGAFDSPAGLALHPDGTLWVADTGHAAIRRLDLANPQATPSTVATIVHDAADGERWEGDALLAIDRDGIGYYVDTQSHHIHRIAPGGTVSEFASTTAPLAGKTPVPSAPITGLAVDPDGNVLVIDALAAKLRRFAPAGREQADAPAFGDFLCQRVTAGIDCGTLAGCFTLAPNGTAYAMRWQEIATVTRGGKLQTRTLERPRYLRDGPGSRAIFAMPEGIAFGADGALYVADRQNHTIRRVDLDAPVHTVTTFAGGLPGSVDGRGSHARFQEPCDLALDPASGDLLVASHGAGPIRRIAPDGTTTTIDGLFGRAVAVGPSGKIYALDGRTVHRRSGDGKIDIPPGGRDFEYGMAIAVDARERLYVADWDVALDDWGRNGMRIRQVSSDGQQHVVLEQARSWTGGWGLLYTPADPRPSGNTACGLAFGPDGALYVTGTDIKRLLRVTDLP